MPCICTRFKLMLRGFANVRLCLTRLCLFATLCTVAVISVVWAPIIEAHGTGHATVRIVRTPQATWIFELQAPLSTLDDAMRHWSRQRGYSVDNIESNSNEYKELLVDYIKQRFTVTAVHGKAHERDLVKPFLGEGRMKLGQHISVFSFEILHMPNRVEDLTFTLPYMQELQGQQNLLQLIDNARSFRAVLKASNQYSLVGTDFFNTVE